MKIAIIGAGSWGTALAAILGEKYQDVALWAHKQKTADDINVTHHNAKYLPQAVLSEHVHCTASLDDAVRDAGLIVMVVPSQAMRATAAAIHGMLLPQAVLVSAAKGFELNSLKRMTTVLAEELPEHKQRIAALSGPNHAEEVGLKYPSATVVGCADPAIAQLVQDIFMMPYFRVYSNPDVTGVELGGALKNIIALGAGISDGLGFGDNTRAALMTRGIAEITRLGIAMGANPLTFAGLAGVGDLIATCTSRHSRNHRAGIQLAAGNTVEEITAGTTMVVEGILTTKAASILAVRYGIELPITKQIYDVLYNGKQPSEAVKELMLRAKSHEVEEVAQPAANITKKNKP